MKVSVLVAAAGTGSRMKSQEKKQFMTLDDVPVLIHTLRVFDHYEKVSEIIVVTDKNDIDRVKRLIDQFKILTPVKVTSGGSRRQDSIKNGLSHVSGDVVMIHDGARPFVDHHILDRHLDLIKGTDGLITCVPCKDTIKRVVGDAVETTLDRSTLVNVQTPQTFWVETIIKAYDQMNDLNVTDDASLMEQLGYTIKTVMGSYKNIKLTTPEDILIGHLFIGGR